MSDLPSPDAFSRNEKPREYTAHIDVRGTISVSLNAESLEDAKRQAEAEIERIRNDGFVDVDEVEEAEIRRVEKDRPMFLVTREGRKMQVSRLEPGDQPRAPDERGF